MTKENKQYPLVSIWCAVYNHEPYIRQCLEGFLTQKTNFQFEAIIHDDASTDSSAQIIQEYADKHPHIIKPILEKENQYSKGVNFLGVIRNKACRGKYIAYCEGDDYWTDPLKLQKEIDILESHPDVMMVHTAFRDVDGLSQPISISGREDYYKKSIHGNAFVNLIKGNYVKTLTTVYRREVLESEILKHSPFKFDYAISLTAAAMGKIAYLPEKTGCYRIINTGMMHTMGEKVLMWTNCVRLYFIQCMLKGQVQGLTKADLHKVVMYVWGQVLSRHPTKENVLFIIRNPQIFRFLPYALKTKFFQ